VILFPLPHDKLVVVASMMPEAIVVSHGYSIAVVSGQVVFWGWQGNLRPLLTRDPAVYREDKTDSASDAHAPCYIYG
jgi:hypothetical protein